MTKNGPKYERTGSVSYEHEIQKIMKSTKVSAVFIQMKQVNIKSLVACLENLTAMLNDREVVWLHISCHGKPHCLRFEKDTK